MLCLPSAEAPVVVDNLHACNGTEAREDVLQLLGGNLVVEIANVEHLLGRRVVLAALSGALTRALTRTLARRPVCGLCNLLQGIGTNGGFGIGRLGLRLLLCGRQTILHGWLCGSLRKVLIGPGRIVASKSALEGYRPLLLLCAESGGREGGNGPWLCEESLGRCCADGTNGGTA
jgi:hypothetical protein